MSCEWALHSSRERIAALKDARLDSHAYRAAVLVELAAHVGYDFWVWPLADPQTTVGIAPMAQGPFAAELPALIALRYRTPVNRWTVLPSNPSRALSLQGATGGQPWRCGLWPLLQRYGVVNVLSLAFADRGGAWGWLELWRGKGRSNFSQAEAHCLELLAGVVATGLRECSAGSSSWAVPAEPGSPCRGVECCCAAAGGGMWHR